MMSIITVEAITKYTPSPDLSRSSISNVKAVEVRVMRPIKPADKIYNAKPQ